jgi:hypothetical protein
MLKVRFGFFSANAAPKQDPVFTGPMQAEKKTKMNLTHT